MGGEIMKRFLIKVTYLDGLHKGEWYLMRKGGYVTQLDCPHFESETYATEAIVKRVCTRLYNNNELNRKLEDRDREYAKQKGREVHEWHIYEHESYEPYEIECSKNIL